MSRDIINEGPILVNTFAGGKEFGECVQFTTVHEARRETPNNNPDDGYVTMTRDEAILFLSKALYLLLEQKEHDKRDPPWWQL